MLFIPTKGMVDLIHIRCTTHMNPFVTLQLQTVLFRTSGDGSSQSEMIVFIKKPNKNKYNSKFKIYICVFFSPKYFREPPFTSA